MDVNELFRAYEILKAHGFKLPSSDSRASPVEGTEGQNREKRTDARKQIDKSTQDIQTSPSQTLSASQGLVGNTIG